MTEEPRTLLVVDDNEDNLDMLARKLERKGYIVLRARGGREALEIVARTQVDLIVLLRLARTDRPSSRSQ